jgi:undecaprenyl pyrophosphate phosphatase UppP
MVLCIAWYYSNPYLCVIKQQVKNTIMKKFIFSASVFVLMAMVPAVLVGYLQTSTDTKPATETVSDVAPAHDNGSLIRLVKSF